MKIHKDTIASELQLFIDNVNSKEQAVEEIAAYIRWRDKQLTIPDVTERFSPDSDEIEQMAMDIDDFMDDVKQTGRVGTYSKRLRTYLAQKLNEYAR